MKFLRITIAFAAVISALAFHAQAQPGTRKIARHLSDKEGLFDAKGVKLHYIVEGEGDPVVLIHGLRSGARINWQTPGIVNLLSKKYKVIAMDMPGHGESDKPANKDAYGLELVEDVVSYSIISRFERLIS